MSWAANCEDSWAIIYLRPADFMDLWNCRGPLITMGCCAICLRPADFRKLWNCRGPLIKMGCCAIVRLRPADFNVFWN